MRSLSLVALCAIAALSLNPTLAADSGKGKSGYCNDDDDCLKKAKDYTCVAVQTTRDNVENVKQCLPQGNGQQVCTGTLPGLCPSFSTTWGASFRQIASVCAYIIPGDGGKAKVKCVEAGAPADNSTKGAVECMFVNDPDNEGKQIGVIYGCVDYDGSRLLFQKSSKSDKLQRQFNYTDVINDGCINPKNPKGSSFVCSSQGTCAPEGKGQMKYSCKCNVGFSGKFCEKIEDNKCYHDGVCGGGSCDLVKQECTKCKAGTKGPKCSECDASAEKVCSGRGTCGPAEGNGTSTVCKCDEGWTDYHCGVKVAVKQPIKDANASDAAAPTPAPSSASSLVMSLTAVAATVVAAASLF
ncbi:hypothetical protein ATCC90586_004947 [Pythium insidiosum]|nr:hypothetical protein ATCC90586_004947 [Pythium insidiosum]